jgi:hypothetical protein
MMMSKIALTDISEFIFTKNLLKSPTNFNSSYWNKVKSKCIPNIEISLVGNRTADKIVEDNSAGIHGVTGRYEVKPKVKTYTASCYLKGGERSYCRYYLADGKQQSCVTGIINLENGLITHENNAGFSNHVSRSVMYGNRWWKLSIEAMSDGLNRDITLMFQIAKSPETYQYLGDGSSGFYIWGGQLLEKK